MTSRALAKLGYKVISACLTDEGMERLKNVVCKLNAPVINDLLSIYICV